MFVALPSEGLPSLRTDVPPITSETLRAARTRCAGSGPLVSPARGRLRRRLGGRRRRADPPLPPASKAAARTVRGPPSRARHSPLHRFASRQCVRPRRAHGAVADARKGTARGPEPWSSGSASSRSAPQTCSRSRAFYEALGWRSGCEAESDVVFFQSGGMVLALWDREKLAEDSGVSIGSGYGGVTLARNVGIARRGG